MDKNDIIISSRVRLARNIADYPFIIKDERAKLVAKKVIDIVSPLDNFSVYPISRLSELDGRLLVEKHLISPDLLDNKEYGVAVINANQTVSIMINEEDHIREQCILPGLALNEALNQLNIIDDILSKNLDFAFDNKLGYLTGCLTNLGTGLRASVMLFLPGITLSGQLDGFIYKMNRLNMTVRGVYGEGTEYLGCMYQISNQKTLGISEEETILSVKLAIEQIVETEKAMRMKLIRENGDELIDKILRAYGVLTNSYTLGTREFTELYSYLKLGIFYGLFEVQSAESLQDLITEVQPAGICLRLGHMADASVRDKIRAKIVSERLNSNIKRLFISDITSK